MFDFKTKSENQIEKDLDDLKNIFKVVVNPNYLEEYFEEDDYAGAEEKVEEDPNNDIEDNYDHQLAKKDYTNWQN